MAPLSQIVQLNGYFWLSMSGSINDP